MWILFYTKATLVQVCVSKEIFDSFTCNLPSLYLLRRNMFRECQLGLQTTPTMADIVNALLLSLKAMASKVTCPLGRSLSLSGRAGVGLNTQKQICTSKIHRWLSYFSRNGLVSWEYLLTVVIWNFVMPPSRMCYVDISFVQVQPVCHVWMDGPACCNHVFFLSKDTVLQATIIFHLLDWWFYPTVVL